MMSITPPPTHFRTRRAREVHCAIASKSVRVSLRSGRGFQEPGTVYVRCDERDCQYVDANAPPCPLRVEMFADASDDVVRAHLAARNGGPLCYECLGAAIGLPHERIRDAVRRITAPGGVRVDVRPSRCIECRTRRLTVLVERADGGAGTRPTEAGDATGARGDATTSSPAPACAAAADVTSTDGSPDVRARVLDALGSAVDTRLCGSCLAFAMEAPLSDARRVTEALHADPSFVAAHAACGRCGRIEDVIGLG